MKDQFSEEFGARDCFRVDEIANRHQDLVPFPADSYIALDQRGNFKRGRKSTREFLAA